MPNQLQLDGEIQTLDEDQRLIRARVVPWGLEAQTQRGVETFEKGAFEGIDPGRFLLRQRHQDPPTGRGVELEEKDDALYMAFRVARTAAGDEQLTLARDGIETGVSVGWEDGEVERKQRPDGRMHYNHKRVSESGVLEVSTTYKPAFRQESQVLQVLERDTETVTDPIAEAPVPAVSEAVSPSELNQLQQAQEAMLAQLAELRELQSARNVMVPQAEEQRTQREVVLQVRELAEVITTPNTGVLPNTLSSEMLGRITAGRPFLNSTREIPPPPAGVTLLFPKITQHPTVAKQAAEKDELSSQATAISTVNFPMETYGGAGDLSMQLIQRSSPQFLSLWLELLGEQYANVTDNAAVDDLLGESAVVEGGEFDPSAPVLGGAFTNTITATNATMRPDRIWLSTAALVAFMDAREPAGGGGRPLYPNLAGIGSDVVAPDGSNVQIRLQPVWVPALDDEAVDLIIGPSRGFVWAEDGTYTLQADVPAKFGRDVGLAGMIWFAPIYPAAFTSYTLAS